MKGLAPGVYQQAVDQRLSSPTEVMSKLSDTFSLYRVSLPRLCLISPLSVTLFTLAIYLLACEVLRFRRVRKLENRYRKKDNERDGNDTIGRPDVVLTPQEMQEIIFTSLEYDMPGLMFYALTFALFKTYGIVSAVQNACSPIDMTLLSSLRGRSTTRAILLFFGPF